MGLQTGTAPIMDLLNREKEQDEDEEHEKGPSSNDEHVDLVDLTE